MNDEAERGRLMREVDACTVPSVGVQSNYQFQNPRETWDGILSSVATLHVPKSLEGSSWFAELTWRAIERDHKTSQPPIIGHHHLNSLDQFLGFLPSSGVKVTD